MAARLTGMAISAEGNRFAMFTLSFHDEQLTEICCAQSGGSAA
jgi:hypothetical protein